jgi:hypothetical protein
MMQRDTKAITAIMTKFSLNRICILGVKCAFVRVIVLYKRCEAGEWFSFSKEKYCCCRQSDSFRGSKAKCSNHSTFYGNSCGLANPKEMIALYKTPGALLYRIAQNSPGFPVFSCEVVGQSKVD